MYITFLKIKSMVFSRFSIVSIDNATNFSVNTATLSGVILFKIALTFLLNVCW